MERAPYFHWRQMLTIMLLAMASGSMFTWLPVKDIHWEGVAQPGSVLALFGGVIFVFWISFSRQIIDRKYTELVVSIFIASVAWIMNPWYGTMDYGVGLPLVFNIWRYAGIIIMGVIIQLTGPRLTWLSLLGGGLGNLVSVGLTWVAFGFHSDYGYRWVFPESLAIFAVGAIVSGGIGILLAHGVTRGIKIVLPGFKI